MITGCFSLGLANSLALFIHWFNIINYASTVKNFKLFGIKSISDISRYTVTIPFQSNVTTGCKNSQNLSTKRIYSQAKFKSFDRVVWDICFFKPLKMMQGISQLCMLI